jgi:hypothetical protein
MRVKDPPQNHDFFGVCDPFEFHIRPPLVVFVIRLEHGPCGLPDDVVSLDRQTGILGPVQRIVRQLLAGDERHT